MNHQRDRDMVGATDTIEMVLDVADNEADLVEIIEVIDDLEFGRGRCLGGCARASGGTLHRKPKARPTGYCVDA